MSYDDFLSEAGEAIAATIGPDDRWTSMSPSEREGFRMAAHFVLDDFWQWCLTECGDDPIVASGFALGVLNKREPEAMPASAGK